MQWAVHRAHSLREGISWAALWLCQGLWEQWPPAWPFCKAGHWDWPPWPVWELRWRKGEPGSAKSPRELWLVPCQSSFLFRARAAEIQPGGWLPDWQHLRPHPSQPCGILLALYGSSTDINYWQQNAAQKQHLFSLKTYLAILSFTTSPVGLNFILTHRTTSTKGACLPFLSPLHVAVFSIQVSVWL